MRGPDVAQQDMRAPQLAPKRRYLLPSIVTVGLIVRIWGINAGFPHGHQYFFQTDEGGLLHVIMGLGTGDLNPHYFSQPGLFLYLVFFILGVYYLIGKVIGSFPSPELFAYHYFSDPSDFYLLGRMASVVFGTLSLVLVYHIGKKAYNRRVGVIAAWFLAVTPLHVTLSHTMKTDVTSVFFMLLAVWFSIQVLRGEATRYYVLAGLFSGLALGTRYPTGLVMALVPLAHWLKFEWRRHDVIAHACDRRVVLSLATGAVAFALVSPFSLLDFGNAMAQLRALAPHVAKGGDPFQIGYLPNYWILHPLQLASASSVGVVFLGISILGVIYALWRRRGEDILLVALPLLFYFLFSYSGFGYTHIPDQYLLPAVPCLIILGARFYDVAMSRLTGNAWVGAAGVVLLSLPALVSTLRTDYVDSQPTTMVVAKQWVEQHIPRGSRILITPMFVPALSFTSESLQRRRATQRGARSVVVGPIRRDVLLNRSPSLDTLRVKSLTELGVPYDLYVILDGLDERPTPELDFYERGLQYAIENLGIQYVIVSGIVRGTYIQDSAFYVGAGWLGRLLSAGHYEVRGARYAAAGAGGNPGFLRRKEFYASMDELCELSKQFRPSPYAAAGASFAPGGPDIRVYRCPRR